ncbi:MAG: hypothetical protein AAF728_13720, partial [Cyanobacteria bacterium P01_D01_bin.128]
MERWEALLENLNIIAEYSSGSEKWTVEDFQLLEQEHDLLLPEEYKKYCQIIGSGVFKYCSREQNFYTRIICPRLKLSELICDSFMSSFIYHLEFFGSIVIYEPKQVSVDNTLAKRILESAF